MHAYYEMEGIEFQSRNRVSSLFKNTEQAVDNLIYISFNLGIEYLLFSSMRESASRVMWCGCFNLGIEYLLFSRQDWFEQTAENFVPVSISESSIFSFQGASAKNWVRQHGIRFNLGIEYLLFSRKELSKRERLARVEFQSRNRVSSLFK